MPAGLSLCRWQHATPQHIFKLLLSPGKTHGLQRRPGVQPLKLVEVAQLLGRIWTEGWSAAEEWQRWKQWQPWGGKVVMVWRSAQEMHARWDLAHKGVKVVWVAMKGHLSVVGLSCSHSAGIAWYRENHIAIWCTLVFCKIIESYPDQCFWEAESDTMRWRCLEWMGWYWIPCRKDWGEL